MRASTVSPGCILAPFGQTSGQDVSGFESHNTSVEGGQLIRADVSCFGQSRVKTHWNFGL